MHLTECISHLLLLQTPRKQSCRFLTCVLGERALFCGESRPEEQGLQPDCKPGFWGEMPGLCVLAWRFQAGQCSSQGTALIHHTSFPGHEGHKDVCQLALCETSGLIPRMQTCARAEPGKMTVPFDKGSKARSTGGGRGPCNSTQSRPCICTGLYSFHCARGHLVSASLQFPHAPA